MIENKSLGSKIFDVLNVVFLVIVMLICIMPVWYVLCVSLSSREAVNAGKVAFWPVGFNLLSYQKILGEGEFFGSFLISIKRVVLGTAVSMVCVLMAAFPLSRTKKQFPHKGIFMWILVFSFQSGCSEYVLLYSFPFLLLSQFLILTERHL